MFNFLDKEGLMYLVLKIKKLIADANVKIATKDTAGIIKGGDNYIAEGGTLTLITETTETTMPNSCEGRLLFKEIRGKTEKLTSTGSNLAEEVTVGDNLVRYASALNVKMDIKSNTQYTFSFKGTVGNSYYINENVFEANITFTVTGGVNTFTATTKSELVGSIIILKNNKDQPNQNKFEEVMVVEGGTALPYEPYGVGTPFIRSVEISKIKTHDGNGNESLVTFSKPIELNKMGNVQDVIVDEKPIRRITKKRITSNMAIVNNPDWANRQAFVIESFFSDGLQVYDAGFSTVANILCTHAPTSSAVEIAGGSVMNGVAQNMYTNLFFSFENCATLDAVKTFLDNNVVEVYYELATPITSLPTANQVALNSVKTFDGTTHLEFDSPLKPKFVAEYGTSKVGGVALEAKGESQANGENIEEMNSAMEAMNAILQNAFVPKGTTPFEGDINLCVESGIYRIGSSISNAPYGNGFLIVFAWLPNVLIQVNMSYLPSYTAVRTCWYGTWNPWYRITTTEIK